MVALDGKKRPSIDDILQHPWMQGDMVDEESWKADFMRRKDVVDAEAKRDRERKQEAREQSDHHRAASNKNLVFRSGRLGLKVPTQA